MVYYYNVLHYFIGIDTFIIVVKRICVYEVICGCVMSALGDAPLIECKSIILYKLECQ